MINQTAVEAPTIHIGALRMQLENLACLAEQNNANLATALAMLLDAPNQDVQELPSAQMTCMGREMLRDIERLDHELKRSATMTDLLLNSLQDPGGPMVDEKAIL